MRGTFRLLDGTRQASPQESDPLHYAAAAAFVMLNGDGHVDTVHRMLVGAIAGGAHRYDAGDTALLRALWALALICFLGGRRELWDTVPRRGGPALSPGPPPILALTVDMFADPARTGVAALPRLEAALRTVHHEVDPSVIDNIAAAAMYADRLAEVREPLWRPVLRAARAVLGRRHLVALMDLCVDDFHRGEWQRSRRTRRRRAPGQRGARRPVLRLVLPLPPGAAGRRDGPVRHQPGAGRPDHRLGRGPRRPHAAGLRPPRAGAGRPRPGRLRERLSPCHLDEPGGHPRPVRPALPVGRHGPGGGGRAHAPARGGGPARPGHAGGGHRRAVTPSGHPGGGVRRDRRRGRAGPSRSSARR